MNGELLDARIEQDHLSEWLEVIRTIADECKLDLSDDGLHTSVVDPANVAYTETALSPAAFDAYEFGDDEPAVYGLNASTFAQSIGVAAGSDTVRIQLDDHTRMSIDAGGVGFDRAGINPDTIRKRPEIPDLDYDVTIERLPAATLQRGVKAADMVSDHVDFVVDADESTAFIEAEGDTDDASLDLMTGDAGLKAEADADATMSLDYLKDMVKGLPSDSTVTLNLKSDFPLRIDFAPDDYAAKGSMFLAPRIESD